MKNTKRRSKQIFRYFSILICMLFTFQLLAVTGYAAETQENKETVDGTTAVLEKEAEVIETKQPANQEPVQVTLSKQVVLKGTSTPVTVKVTNEDKLVGTKTYYSSNPKVATIDATGTVKVVGVGETVITVAYSGDEEHNPTFGSAAFSVTQSYSVIQKKAQKEFEVTLSIDTVKAGVDVVPKVQTTDETKLVGTRTYHSSNPEVATISAITGKLTIVGGGTTVISVVYSGDSNRSPIMASTLLHVEPAMQLTLDQDVVQLESEKTPEVTAVVTNEENLLGAKTYQSSNPKVATIDAKSGKITVVGVGDTIISVTYEGEKGKHGPVVASDILRVTKDPKEAEKEDQAKANVGITYSSVKKGASTKPEIIVTNEDELVGTKTYQSSNPKVATIDVKTGKITVVGKGNTMITVIFAGDENHKPTIGSIMLTVEPEGSSSGGSSSSESGGNTGGSSGDNTGGGSGDNTGGGSGDNTGGGSGDNTGGGSGDNTGGGSGDNTGGGSGDGEEEDSGLNNPTGPTERPSGGNSGDGEEEDSGLNNPTGPTERPSGGNTGDAEEEGGGLSGPTGPVNRPTENTTE